MSLRIPILLLATLLPLAALPLGEASSDCDEARRRLTHEWDASGGTITPPVARAIKATADACPHILPSPELALSAPGPIRPPADARDPGPLAVQCGFTDRVSFHDADANLTLLAFAPGEVEDYSEKGEADVAYVPQTDLTHYDSHGPNIGLSASANAVGAGFLIIHGQRIAATEAQAASGCAAVGGPLCWGEARVSRSVPLDGLRVLNLVMHGEANACET